MRLKTKVAHELMCQFVAWNRFNLGRGLGYPIAVPWINQIQRNRKNEESKSIELQSWFADEEALAVNDMLSMLKEDRPLEFKVLMYHYFTFQQVSMTSKKFRIYPQGIQQIIGAALGYIDGYRRIIEKIRKSE